MKRTGFILIFILLCFCISTPISAHAKEMGINKYLTEGYTPEGIHYTIYDIPTTAPSSIMSIQQATTQKYLTRMIYFDGYIVPPNTWYFVEHLDNNIYVGTLSLTGIRKSPGKTIATYKGYLILVN